MLRYSIFVVWSDESHADCMFSRGSCGECVMFSKPHKLQTNQKLL